MAYFRGRPCDSQVVRSFFGSYTWSVHLEIWFILWANNLFFQFMWFNAFRVTRREYAGSITHTMNNKLSTITKQKTNRKKSVFSCFLLFIRYSCVFFSFFFVEHSNRKVEIFFFFFFFGKENARHFFPSKIWCSTFRFRTCVWCNKQWQANKFEAKRSQWILCFFFYSFLFNSKSKRCHHRPKISFCKQKWAYSFYVCIRV